MINVEFQYVPKKRKVRIVSDFFNNIREHFSVKNPGARFSTNRFIPQRLYAITPEGYCGIGLVFEIVKYLNSLNIVFNFIYNDDYLSVISKMHLITDTGHEFKELECDLKLRPYQKEAVIETLKRGCGNVVIGTSGGKTLIMATLIYNTNALIGKTLVIVPDIGLVEQTYRDFISYGLSPSIISRWTGKHKPELYKNIIIANLGILQSKNTDKSWFDEVGILIFDECHKIRKHNLLNKIIDKIPSLNRFGFTGTLPEDLIDQWNIINKIGPVIYEKTVADIKEESIKDGIEQYIVNAQVLAIQIDYSVPPDYTAVAPIYRYRTELDYIHSQPFRYKVIKRVLQNINNNCLILVDQLAHGKVMAKYFESVLPSKQVFFIQGIVEVEDRRKIQELMEKHDNVVCIAISKIFSTGISIKNIHYIMFAAGGKSKIKTLQSIGRGLRTNTNKDTLTIIDIVDNLIYGKKHYEKRKQFYKLERIPVQVRQITET